MPIELSTNDDPDLNVRAGTNEATLLKFLYRHPRYGYLPKELAEETPVPYQSVQKTLDRLREKNLIGKTEHGYYHALDDETIARRVAGLRSLDALAHDLREADPITAEEVDDLPDLAPEQAEAPAGTNASRAEPSLTQEEVDEMDDLTDGDDA